MIVKVEAPRGAGRGPSDIRRQTRALSLSPLSTPNFTANFLLQLINDGSSPDIRLSISPFCFFVPR